MLDGRGKPKIPLLLHHLHSHSQFLCIEFEKSNLTINSLFLVTVTLGFIAFSTYMAILFVNCIILNIQYSCISLWPRESEGFFSRNQSEYEDHTGSYGYIWLLKFQNFDLWKDKEIERRSPTLIENISSIYTWQKLSIYNYAAHWS